MQHSSWIRKELNTDVTFDVNQVRLEASSIFFTDNLISYLSESKGFLSSVVKQTEFPSSKYLVVTLPPSPPPHPRDIFFESIVEFFLRSHRTPPICFVCSLRHPHRIPTTCRHKNPFNGHKSVGLWTKQERRNTHFK